MSEVSSTLAPLSEREIKSAVIEYLTQKKVLDDGVIINELPVANWSRRADLAVANGKLQAIEIKSDLDSLRRLDGQISLFSTRFDKVVLVTTSRFLNAAIERLPVAVEIWEASRRLSGVTLRVVRRGQTKEIRNHHILAAYLQKPELVSFLRAHGRLVSPSTSRDELEEAVSDVPVSKLRKFVLHRLKQRYQREQASPLLTRAERARAQDMPLKNVVARRGIGVSRSEPAFVSARRVSFSGFESKFGELPDDMPEAVTVRRQR